MGVMIVTSVASSGDCWVICRRHGSRAVGTQVLARHSDIRLTLGTYTHVQLQDQTNAIAALPGPPCGATVVAVGVGA